MLKQFFKCFFALFSIISNLYSTESEIFVSKCLPDSPDPETSYTQFIVKDIYEHQRAELSKSSIYFLVTAYEQEKFAPNLARSLKLNYDRLREFGVDFQIRLTCDGRDEDRVAFERAFLSSGIPQDNFIISLNPINKGVSLTRYEQLLSSRDEIMRDIASGKYVYFSIFDGDDMMHQDWCRLMLATALETNADVVGIERFAARCHECDISIVEQFQAVDINHFTLGYISEDVFEFCTNLFKASCIYNSEFNFDFSEHDKYDEPFYKNESLATLSPLTDSDLFKLHINLCRRQNKLGEKTLFYATYVSEIEDEFIPMHFYMQHPGSLEHSMLKRMLRDIDNQDFVRFQMKDGAFADLLVFFGILYQGRIDERLIKTSERNIDIDEEFLIERFKNKHLLANRFKKITESTLQGYDEEDRRDIEFILNHSKTQELLAQDTSKPLSDDFIKIFYRNVFDIILGLKPNPKPAIDAINEIVTPTVSSELDYKLQRKLDSGEYIPPVECFITTKKGKIQFIDMICYPEHDVITTPTGEKISIPHEDYLI